MEAAIGTVLVLVQRFEQIANELEVLEALNVLASEGRAGFRSGLSTRFVALVHIRNVAHKALCVKAKTCRNSLSCSKLWFFWSYNSPLL